MKFLFCPALALTLIVACGTQGSSQQSLGDDLGGETAAAAALASSGVPLSGEAGTEQEPDTSFLSESSRTNLQKLKEKHVALREAAQAICSPDKALHESLKSQLDAIRGDASKSEADKHAAFEALIAQNQEQLASDREKMEACFSDNKAALDALHDKAHALAQACLAHPERRGPGRPEGGIGRRPGEGPQFGKVASGAEGAGPGLKPAHKGHGKKQGPGPVLSEAAKEAINTKLSSEECTQALSAE